MKPQVYIDKLFIKQDNVNGDNNLWLGTDGTAQKIDAGAFLWVAFALVGGSITYVGYKFVLGFAVGAAAFGVAAAPVVIGGALTVGATWAGIKGVKAHQTRLIAQAATIAPALPLPAFDYRALPAPMREFAAEYYAHTGRHLSHGQLEALEMQLVARQIQTQCASLPSPSDSLPLPASRSAPSC